MFAVLPSRLNSVNGMSFVARDDIGWIHGSDPVRPASRTDIPSCCLDEEMDADPNLPNAHRVPSCLVLPPRFGFTVLTSFSEAAKDGKMVMPQPNDKVRGGLASGCLALPRDAPKKPDNPVRGRGR